MVIHRFSNRIVVGSFLVGLLGTTFLLPGQETVTTPLLELNRGTLSGAAWSPDGTRAVVAEGAEAYIFDASVGTPGLEELQELHGHTAPVRAVTFSPRGGAVLTASDDGTARVWDAVTGRTALVLEGHSGPVRSAAYSPDGRWAVTGSLDQTAIIWDALAGTKSMTLTGHALGIISVAWSHDGTRILTGSWDETVRLWDADTGALIRTYADVSNPVAFSPDDTEFTAGGPDNTAKRVDIETGEVLQTFAGHDAGVTCVDYSPDGQEIVTGSWDWTLRTWNPATGDVVRVLTGHNGGVISAEYSFDGEQILSAATTPGNRALIWEAATGTIRNYVLGHSSQVYALAFTPDGAGIVSGDLDGRVRLWDVASGQMVRSFVGHTGIVRSVAFSPDGQQLLTGSDDGTARLWSLSTGEMIQTVAEMDSFLPVGSVAFTPGGSRMILGADRIYVYGSGGELLLTFGEPVRDFALSPDGERIAALVRPSDYSDHTDTVAFYETRTGHLLGTWRRPHSYFSSVAYSPDGRYVSVGGPIRILDTSTFEQVASYDVESGTGASLAYSPDGQYIAAGGAFTLYLLRAATGEVVRTFHHPNGSAYETSVAFSPDRMRIASVAGDRIHIWDSGLPPYPVGSEAWYRFSDTPNGWEFEPAAPFAAPSAAFWPGDPGGLLLRATNNTSTFGYWVGPLMRFGDTVEQLDPKPLGLQPPSDAIYDCRFTVRSQVTDRSRVPQLRVRVSEADGRQSNFLAVESGADGFASPGVSGKEYHLLFTPATTAAATAILEGRLAFDLLNFDPGDDPTGDLQLDEVEIRRHTASEIGDRTPLKTYDFSQDHDGWTSHSVAPFDSPEFGTEPGALTMRGTEPTGGPPQAFGFWSSPDGDIPATDISGPVVYIATFEVESSLAASDRSRTPQFRVRLNDGIQHSAAVLAIESTGDGGRSPIAGETARYVVYYVPQQPIPEPTASQIGGSELQVSFDYLNFSAMDDPAATLKLLQVDIEAAPFQLVEVERTQE